MFYFTLLTTQGSWFIWQAILLEQGPADGQLDYKKNYSFSFVYSSYKTISFKLW